jgi:hypothetical protein
MALSACEQKTEWLADAIAARHALITGAREVLIQHADKRIEFTAANLNALARYIIELQAAVDACNGVRGSRRSMLNFVPRS